MSFAQLQVCQYDKHNNSNDYQPTNCGEVSKAAWTIDSRDRFTVVYGSGDETPQTDYVRLVNNLY